MPNTKSAKKALRSSLRKKAFNDTRKNAIKASLRELREVLATKPKNYQPVLNKVYSALDKAVKRNLIHKNRASRKKSRVAKLVDRTLNEKKKK